MYMCVCVCVCVCVCISIISDIFKSIVFVPEYVKKLCE